MTSVLFGDLVGFTTLAEARDQEDVRELLSRYFDACRQVIARYGGTVEKFIGDAVMAVWGVPVAHEDDAERAVRAGLELVALVAALGDEVGIPGLALRVGIVTGEVAVTIGATNEGMVAGDAVNTAARVQTAAAPGQVWVDETTRLLTLAAITYSDAGSHQLRGKADPVPLWTVRAVVAAVGGAQRADGLEAPLVGRDRELRLVKELFHRTEESGQPTLLVVAGEAGVGKSRLAWEFSKYTDGLSSGVSWHSGRCVAYGEGVAFFALAEAVRGRLRAGSDLDQVDGQDEAAALERTLDSYVLDPGEREWLRPRIGALVGIGAAATFPREDLFTAWVTFLERVGQGDPVVLVIDDAQHADDGFVLFLEHLLSAASFGCFVLLLARPELLEAHPSIATNRRATLVHLPALSDRDVAVLLDGLVAGLPQVTRDQLVRRSEGLPLFAVETVRSLIDRDLVVPRGGQYILADPDSLDLETVGAPASLQALIAARLDTLTSDQRRLVDRATVLGTAFTVASVAELCRDLDDPSATLDQLVRLQILSREANRLSSEFGHYAFVQSVVRQVAYSTLSRRVRKATHLQVVTQFESAGDDADDTAAIRAQHYLDAVEAMPDAEDVTDLKAAALANLRRAGARARSLGSPAEAARHLVVAYGLAEEPAVRGVVARELARCECDAGLYDPAIEHAEAAETWAVAAGLRAEAGSAAAIRAEALGQGRGEHERALAVAQPWWEELRGDTESVGAQLALSRVVTWSRSRTGLEYREALEGWIQLANRAGDRGSLADAYTSLALYYGDLRLIELSRVLLAAASELAREEHQPVVLARTLLNLTASWMLDDLSRARAFADEAVSLTSSLGRVFLHGIVLSNLVAGRWWTGEWDRLTEEMPVDTPGDERRDPSGITVPMLAMLDLARGKPVQVAGISEMTVDDVQERYWASFARALEATSRGDHREAARLGRAAVDLAFGLAGFTDDACHIWPQAVEMAMAAGDDATVQHLLTLADGEGRGLPLGVRAHRQHVAGRLAMSNGDPGAEAALRAAIADFETWGALPYRARAHGDLARLLREQSREEEAAVFLDQARAVLEPLGAVTWLAEMDPDRAPVTT